MSFVFRPYLPLAGKTARHTRPKNKNAPAIAGAQKNNPKNKSALGKAGAHFSTLLILPHQ
jgi:hypothetical protein